MAKARRNEEVAGDALAAFLAGRPVPEEAQAVLRLPKLPRKGATSNQRALFAACGYWLRHSPADGWVAELLAAEERPGLSSQEPGADYRQFVQGALCAVLIEAQRRGAEGVAARASRVLRWHWAFDSLFATATPDGVVTIASPGIRANSWSHEGLCEALALLLGLRPTKRDEWYERQPRRGFTARAVRDHGVQVFTAAERQSLRAWVMRDSKDPLPVLGLLAGARLRWPIEGMVDAGGILEAWMHIPGPTNDHRWAVVLGPGGLCGQLRAADDPMSFLGEGGRLTIERAENGRQLYRAVAQGEIGVPHREGWKAHQVDATLHGWIKKERLRFGLGAGGLQVDGELLAPAQPSPAPPSAEPEPAPQPAPSPGDELEAARAAVREQLGHAQRLLEQPAVPWKRVAERLEAGATLARRAAGSPS